MIPPARRIIVLDDEQDHLNRLSEGIRQFNIPFLPLYFTGEKTDVPACPNVRVIFADLHLVGGIASDHKKDFSVIGNLIEDTIKPTGPYLILLWTRYPDQAPALRAFLERLQGVTKPVDVLPISKIDHLDGNGDVKSEATLVSTIDSLAKGWLRPEGVFSLQGAWKSLDDREVDEVIEEIYAARRRDTGRLVELED